MIVTDSLSTRSEFKQINLITNIWYIIYLWRHLGDNKLCRTPTPLKALIPSVVVPWLRLLNLNDSVDGDSLADVKPALYELSLTFSCYSCLSSLSFLHSCDCFWVALPVHPSNITVSHWSARGSFQSEIAVAVRTAPSHYNENPILISSIKWLDQQFSATQALALLLLRLCPPPPYSSVLHVVINTSSLTGRKWEDQGLFTPVAVVNHVIYLPFVRLVRSSCTLTQSWLN